MNFETSFRPFSPVQNSVDEFPRMAPRHYEGYERKAPEIFVGEWAAHESIVPWDPRSRGCSRLRA